MTEVTGLLPPMLESWIEFQIPRLGWYEHLGNESEKKKKDFALFKIYGYLFLMFCTSI